MGEVYLARDTKLDRQVAVKVLLPHLAADPERLRRFQQETRAVSSLNHPHILVIHDVGQFEGRAFIVTEYVEGQTLRARLRDGPLNTREVVEIAVQIASALTAAHARGIVHRDIKPENVMVRSDGYVKVLDFGIAKLLITPREHDGDDTRLRTQPGVVMGTPRYMSPEQARGLALDARTDVWSLGVLLYEMIAGRPPFDGATPADVLAAILRAEPAPLSLGATPAAKAAGRLVARTLAKNPADRFASARELHAELTALKTELDSGAGRTPAPRTVTPAASDLQHDHATAIDSLAVLPFVNAGGDPDTEYLSDGIPESLINSLSQIPDLRVVPRSTAFRYKGQDVDPKKAGRQLRVRALLMGKVLQRGDTLHVQVELVDVAKESPLWGERFNRKVADIFTVEEEIAKQISEKLRLTLSGGDRARLLKRYTENTEAYHLYLKGRYHWNKRTGEGLRKAIEYFQQAVESDPTYALAYAGLADGYCVLPFFAAVPAKGAFIRGKADALKALEIDPDLSEALTALGPLQGLLDWDWAGAERSVRRAIEVKPDYWLAHDHYALVLSALGTCGGPSSGRARVGARAVVGRRQPPRRVGVHQGAAIRSGHRSMPEGSGIGSELSHVLLLAGARVRTEISSRRSDLRVAGRTARAGGHIRDRRARAGLRGRGPNSGGATTARRTARNVHPGVRRALQLRNDLRRPGPAGQDIRVAGNGLRESIRPSRHLDQRRSATRFAHLRSADGRSVAPHGSRACAAIISQMNDGPPDPRPREEAVAAPSHDSATLLETPAHALRDAARAEDFSGRQVESYRVLSRIGAGGMGDVYLAHDEKLDRPVALKCLPRHVAADADRLRFFFEPIESATAHDGGPISGPGRWLEISTWDASTRMPALRRHGRRWAACIA